MKKVVLAALLGAGIPACAQSRVGLEAGLQLSNFTQKITLPAGTGKGVGDLRVGFRAGFVIDAPISRDFYLQPGVYYAQRGADDPGGSIKIKTNYIEVPLNLLVKAKLGTGRLFLGGGPYVAFGIGGKVEVGSQSQDLTFGDNGDFKRFDAGLNVTGGYETGMGLFVRGFASSALTNALPGGTSANSVRNWGYGISLGYLLR